MTRNEDRRAWGVVGKLAAAACALTLSSGALAFNVKVGLSLDGAHGTHNVTTTLNGHSVTGRAGRFSGSGSVPAGDGTTTQAQVNSLLADPHGPLMYTWCVEPQNFMVNPDTYGVSFLDHAQKGYIEKLLGGFDYRAGILEATGTYLTDSSALKDRVTAFQIAIWELFKEDETSFDVRNGNFSATIGLRDDSRSTKILDQANEWLGWVTDADNEYFKADSTIRLMRLDAGKNGQDQLGATVVPLPAGVWLFGSGLLVLAGFNSRKRRQA